MIDEHADRRLTQLLEELGPADPPAGFAHQVMERISLENSDRNRGQIVPFHKRGSVMTRKVLWGVAAAAAVVLGVYTFTGFPPVDRGTEGTIGAAQKYQAPQIGDKDVVLGDTAAQEFLQSDTFDKLLKDPQARSLIGDKDVQAQLRNLAFVQAIRNPEVRSLLSSQLLMNVLHNELARTELTRQLSASVSAQAVSQASASAALSAEARAMIAQLTTSELFKQAISNNAVAAAIANPAFQSSLMRLSAGFSRDALSAALASNGFSAAIMNGSLAGALAAQ